MQRFSANYLDSLFSSHDYEKLAELSAIISGSPQFRADVPDYGLPMPAFVFCESLLWFAQALRSGVWTYFEVTPVERQKAMLSALEDTAPTGFAELYAFGSQFWQNEIKMKDLDRWMEEHDEENNSWLWGLVGTHRASMRLLCA